MDREGSDGIIDRTGRRYEWPGPAVPDAVPAMEQNSHRGTAMGQTPAEILESTSTIDEFRDAITATGGDFPFEAADMESLGEIYFIRYPDSSVERNMENIRFGYRMVRICIMEKILQGLDGGMRDSCRDMLGDVARMETLFDGLWKKYGSERVERDFGVIVANLDRVKGTIDSLPRGMIKERFVGGISSFYNNLYLLKQLMAKRHAGAADPR